MTAITESAPSITSTKPTTLRGAWIPLTALCLAFFVEMVDNTLLTIALPTMGRDLGASTTQLQWVTGSYSLVFGSLLLTAGSLADRFGRRRTLLTGLTLFGAISALVWFVTTPGQLIAMRSVLGIAAACMAPVTMSLVFRLFDDEQARMRAITLCVTIGMAAMALGPVIAGTALNHVSWHWLLFVNTPIALAAAAGVLFGIDKDTAADLHDAPIDIPAALLTMATMALGCYALTSGVERGWTNSLTLACFAGAVVALVGFVLREQRAAHPMIELSLLANRTVRGAALVQTGASVAMMGVMFVLIMHFQYALGWSPMKAGLANLPFVITMIAATPVAEGMTKRFGHRTTTAFAVACLVVAMVGLAFSVGHPYWVLAIWMVVMTLGLRIIMTVGAFALIAAVPENRTSLGTALNDVTQEIGSALGTALVGTVIAAIVGAALPEGTWTSVFTDSFFHAERVAYLLIGALVAVIGGYGASTFTTSRSTEEH